MTSNVVFLLAAVVLSVVGCALFLLRNRKPSSLEHGIDSFNREMQALAPGATPMVRDRPGSAAVVEPPPADDDDPGR